MFFRLPWQLIIKLLPIEDDVKNNLEGKGNVSCSVLLEILEVSKPG